MSAWHDRVVDLTLFEALTGGAFDRQNGNIAGNLTKIFQKSQMPRGLPGGGMGGFGIDRYITSAARILGETCSSVMLGKLISYCSALNM